MQNSFFLRMMVLVAVFTLFSPVKSMRPSASNGILPIRKNVILFNPLSEMQSEAMCLHNFLSEVGMRKVDMLNLIINWR